jgi:hypothetical protein
VGNLEAQCEFPLLFDRLDTGQAKVFHQALGERMQCNDIFDCIRYSLCTILERREENDTQFDKHANNEGIVFRCKVKNFGTFALYQNVLGLSMSVNFIG